eukprot:353498-Chlamydomonas_euryale.AAC.5
MFRVVGPSGVVRRAKWGSSSGQVGFVVGPSGVRRWPLLLEVGSCPPRLSFCVVGRCICKGQWPVVKKGFVHGPRRSPPRRMFRIILILQASGSGSGMQTPLCRPKQPSHGDNAVSTPSPTWTMWHASYIRNSAATATIPRQQSSYKCTALTQAMSRLHLASH